MINKNKVEEIYQRIKDKLKSQEGKIVAIDIDSGDYFIGDDTLEAYDKGIKTGQYLTLVLSPLRRTIAPSFVRALPSNPSNPFPGVHI